VWLSLTIFTLDAWRQAHVKMRDGRASGGTDSDKITEAELAPEPT
jgi:hypothetical protein